LHRDRRSGFGNGGSPWLVALRGDEGGPRQPVPRRPAAPAPYTIYPRHAARAHAERWSPRFLATERTRPVDLAGAKAQSRQGRQRHRGTGPRGAANRTLGRPERHRSAGRGQLTGGGHRGAQAGCPGLHGHIGNPVHVGRVLYMHAASSTTDRISVMAAGSKGRGVWHSGWRPDKHPAYTLISPRPERIIAGEAVSTSWCTHAYLMLN
jgi:hypothetical protein